MTAILDTDDCNCGGGGAAFYVDYCNCEGIVSTPTEFFHNAVVVIVRISLRD